MQYDEPNKSKEWKRALHHDANEHGDEMYAYIRGVGWKWLRAYDRCKLMKSNTTSANWGYIQPPRTRTEWGWTWEWTHQTNCALDNRGDVVFGRWRKIWGFWGGGGADNGNCCTHTCLINYLFSLTRIAPWVRVLACVYVCVSRQRCFPCCVVVVVRPCVVDGLSGRRWTGWGGGCCSLCTYSVSLLQCSLIGRTVRSERGHNR